MGGVPGRHAELATELTEWWEDLWQGRIGSQVVLVAVPHGWGRTTVLNRFAAGIASDDARITLTVRVNGRDLRNETIGIQVAKLRACLAESARRHPVAEQLGLDERSGQAGLAMGVAGLFFSGPTAGVSFLLAGLVAGAAGRYWDRSPAGQDGVLARTARAVAAVSMEAPVVVIIDDADWLDRELAVTMVENLIARHHSQVLVVATVDLGSALADALANRARYGLTEGLVQHAEVNPDMGDESRLDLVRRLCPQLPAAASGQIVARTSTFVEVFKVAAAPRLTRIGPETDPADVLKIVDKAINDRLARPMPSWEAVVIAWSRGPVHARQADRALGILGATRDVDDPDVRRWEWVERLTDPADPRLADPADDLATADCRALATAFLDEALTITQASHASLVDKVAALQAAHRIRADLPDRGKLPRSQCELVAALEALGDHAAALQVATDALHEWPAAEEASEEHDVLTAAQIRLSHLTSDASAGPLAQQLIAAATASGAVAGLEARIWAAIVLLDNPGLRDTARTMAEQITADLEAQSGLGRAGDRWRLLLAYHSGRAGLTGLTMRLLSPLITSETPMWQEAAEVVWDISGEAGADFLLRNILLYAELATLPPQADDDRLRIHHDLAENYELLGDYCQALTHGQHELDLRTEIHGLRHPDTLITRGNVAKWIGVCGDAARALRLFQDLQPDMEQVFGPRHPCTLATREPIAYWTGQCGNPAEALRLSQALLPDQEQVLGPHHPSTLSTCSNIAFWTGQCGDPAEALRLSQALLPDQEQVLGPHHVDTLTTRSNIAFWTGQCGNPAEALRLSQALLRDRELVLGPHHADTLTTRGNVALWTGVCGHPAEALRLYQNLLPDVAQILGSRHPQTMKVRGQIEFWADKNKDSRRG